MYAETAYIITLYEQFKAHGIGDSCRRHIVYIFAHLHTAVPTEINMLDMN